MPLAETSGGAWFGREGDHTRGCGFGEGGRVDRGFGGSQVEPASEHGTVCAARRSAPRSVVGRGDLACTACHCALAVGPQNPFPLSKQSPGGALLPPGSCSHPIALCSALPAGGTLLCLPMVFTVWTPPGKLACLLSQHCYNLPLPSSVLMKGEVGKQQTQPTVAFSVCVCVHAHL